MIDKNFCTSKSDNFENKDFITDATNSDAEVCQETKVRTYSIKYFGKTKRQQFSLRLSIHNDEVATTCLSRRKEGIEDSISQTTHYRIHKCQIGNIRYKYQEKNETDYNEIITVS